jgi:hypothetical protein
MIPSHNLDLLMDGESQLAVEMRSRSVTDSLCCYCCHFIAAKEDKCAGGDHAKNTA